MKKNNKGFFLAETIIIVALVTTVMAFVYPNVSKLYDNYKNTSLYYDQTEDLYTLKAYSEVYATNIIERCNNLNNPPAGPSVSNEMCTNCGMGIQKLFIYKYMDSPSPSDANYNFNKYLKRLKKTSNDQNACRLVGVFDGGKFASIKIEKESLYRILYNIPTLYEDWYITLDNLSNCSSNDQDLVTANFSEGKCKITGIHKGNTNVNLTINNTDSVVVNVEVR